MNTNLCLRNLATAICLLCICTCCSQETTIDVDGGKAPTIHVHGTDAVDWIWVYGPQGPEGEGPRIIWKINHTGDPMLIPDLPSITYGKVPEGFEQEIPANGEPPSLVDGQIYGITVVTRGYSHGNIKIRVQNGQSLKVQN